MEGRVPSWSIIVPIVSTAKTQMLNRFIGDGKHLKKMNWSHDVTSCFIFQNLRYIILRFIILHCIYIQFRIYTYQTIALYIDLLEGKNHREMHF